jgi:hypothetical protein
MTINVVALDETHDWADEIQQKVLGSKIYSVYIFNDAEVTHLCEFTPSYWLQFVGIITEPSPELEAYTESLSEEDRDEFYNFELESNSSSIYVHCHQIDGNPTVIQYHSPDPEKAVDDEMEMIRESLQGNGYYPDDLPLSRIAGGWKPDSYSPYDLRHKEIAT